jgi:DNA repair exonuclease SbcCD nuclease subunit
VLFAGDLVEQADDFYEAYGDLHRAMHALEQARIPVLAVAGNHDTLVLPRLAQAIGGLRLLGSQGQWEAVTVTAKNGGHIRVAGWSFPTVQVHHNPLHDGLTELLAQDTADSHGGQAPDAVVGLLHCDRGQHRSAYAPVPAGELLGAPVDAWVLGHIHRPDSLEGQRPIGYLGSLSPLDPGEPGPHGPWLVSVHGPGNVQAAQICNAPLRYERMAVELASGESVQGIDACITNAISALHGSLQAQGVTPKAVACRVLLKMDSDTVPALRAWQAAGDLAQLVLDFGNSAYFVEKLSIEVTQSLDLETLARSDDPAGVLARKLLLIGRPRPMILNGKR